MAGSIMANSTLVSCVLYDIVVEDLFRSSFVNFTCASVCFLDRKGFLLATQRCSSWVVM